MSNISPLGSEDIRDMIERGMSSDIVAGPKGLYDREDLPACPVCGLKAFDSTAFNWTDGLCDDCYEDEQEGSREYSAMISGHYQRVL